MLAVASIHLLFYVDTPRTMLSMRPAPSMLGEPTKGHAREDATELSNPELRGPSAVRVSLESSAHSSPAFPTGRKPSSL